MITKRKVIPLISLLALFIGPAIVTAGEPDPTLIIDRMVDAMRGDSSYAEMTMRIERPPSNLLLTSIWQRSNIIFEWLFRCCRSTGPEVL